MPDSDQIIKKRIAKETIEQLIALNRDEMVERKVEADIHPIIPNTHFAGVSTECAESFIVGHYYASISLAQSIAEGLIKFIAEKKGWKPKGDFEVNVDECLKKTFITTNQSQQLKEIWKNRNDYHHLNKNIPKDNAILREIAKQKIKLLSELEKDLFEFIIVNGAIKPKNPLYWDINQDGTTSVFLRMQ